MGQAWTKVIDNDNYDQPCEKNEMVLGRVNQPPQIGETGVSRDTFPQISPKICTIEI